MSKEKDFEDFADFADGEMQIPDLEEDLMDEKDKFQYNPDGDSSIFHKTQENPEDAIEKALENEPEEEIEETEIKEPQEKTPEEENETEKESKSQEENITQEEIEEESEEKNITSQEEELSQWEELSKDNSVVKKYILYIAKDFIPYIDNLSIDERNAFVNDAIQKKLDLEDEEKQQENKKRLTTHLILTVVTICLLTPFAILGVNKAILATFENYKYSQDNFEKLYKERFAKDKAYMRSVLYNQEQAKKKNKTH